LPKKNCHVRFWSCSWFSFIPSIFLECSDCSILHLIPAFRPSYLCWILFASDSCS
jgi:hypothetical protein